MLKEDRLRKTGSYDVILQRLVGVWDLTKIDDKPATDIFTTEFRQDGTYSVTTVHCREEKGIWSATRDAITATVTHSPNCERNVGRRYSDPFSLYGNILIVYIFDKKHKKHTYKFIKRTVFLTT